MVMNDCKIKRIAEVLAKKIFANNKHSLERPVPVKSGASYNNDGQSPLQKIK